jgi:hypothetical protein
MKNKTELCLASLSALGLILIPGCEFIGDVFKAGVWVGIIIVIAIFAVIAFIIKMFKS